MGTARLINRGTESEQSTQARLDRAKEELSAAAESSDGAPS